MLLGAHWAYVEVGWGGFWAWDPVENAALMPWLMATAFLHSVMVQEKKGMLKAWNVALVTATFALSIFGTFLTRSGIVSSIHAFVASNVGYWFVGYIAVILLGSTALMLARIDLLRSDHQMESLVSREATFLFNNLLFVGLAFAVLWGVTFPLISEAVTGEKITVNAPFFNFFAVVFGLPLILLMGVGPVIAWRRALAAQPEGIVRHPVHGRPGGRPRADRARLRRPSGGARGGLAVASSSRVAIVLEFARGTSARRALAGGSWPGAFVALINRNRRRYGGYIAHFAVVLFVIGATGATAYATGRRGRAGARPDHEGAQLHARLRRRHARHRRRTTRRAPRSCRSRRRQVRSARSRPASAPTRPRARRRTRSRSAPTGAPARTCS